MPSEEEFGAKLGEHVDGAGALPGKVDEERVAVLPDESVRAAAGAGVGAAVVGAGKQHWQISLLDTDPSS